MISPGFLSSSRPAKLFFVHIPRTGGTSLSLWLAERVGPEKSCRHIESILLPQLSLEAIEYLRQFDFVGGHVPVDFVKYFGSSDVQVISIMRDPLDQFFSNICHLVQSRIDDPLLAKVQAKCLHSVNYFLKMASDEELSYFENVQSKALFGSELDWRAVSVDERIDFLSRRYSAILTTETMHSELARHFGPLGISQHGDEMQLAIPYENRGKYVREKLSLRADHLLRGLLLEDVCLYRHLRGGSTFELRTRTDP